MYDIPLPRVVADVGAGGPFVTSANALNNLRIKQAEAQFKPQGLRAEAASKLAYANLMGPQFLAKLMANDPILANMSEEQKTDALQKLYQAGTGQGTGASIFGSLQNPSGGSLAGNIFGGIAGFAAPAVNKLMEKLGITAPSQNVMASSPASSSQNAMINMPGVGSGIQATPQQARAIGNMGPGDSLTIDSNGNAIPSRQRTFAENTGAFKGVVEQGKEAGNIRSKDIQKLGDQYETGLAMNDKYRTLTDLVNNPEFRKMRENIPFFQDKQLNVLSGLGTPAQKEMIGQFKTAANEIMGDIIRSFGAQKFRGESDIARNMKINDNDPFNVIIGKLQASMLYKNLNMERIKIASDLMENKHLSKRQAFDMADKQIDGEKMRKYIAGKLDYPVQIRRKRSDGTYETETVPVSEARNRGITNV